MNNTFRLTLALLVGVTASLTAQTSHRWDLFLALDWEGRQAFLDQPPASPWDEDFLLKALELDDSSQIESGSENVMAMKKSIAIRLVKLLADLPSPKAATAIARLPVQYRDPVLRGEAWMALAKLGDRTAISPLVHTLAALNDSGQRARGEEIQAAYAIQALGLLKAPEAFRAVAAASLGWYSPASGVRALAQKTLALLVPDVPKATVDLLAIDEDLTLKEGLFQAVLDQGDPDYAARAASAILETLVHYQAGDKLDQDRTERLTLATLVGAQKASKPPVSLVTPLKVLLTRADNFQSMVQAVRLLGKIDDKSALDLLSSTLAGYNSKQKFGTNKATDWALVKELFLALAQTGKAAARIPLDEARYSDYTAALIRDAEAALAQLPRE